VAHRTLRATAKRALVPRQDFGLLSLSLVPCPLSLSLVLVENADATSRIATPGTRDEGQATSNKALEQGLANA